MSISSILPENVRKKMVPDSWAIRRRWMKTWTLVLSVNAQIVLFYMLWDGGQNIAAQIIFMALLGVICVISFLYVFGAVYDPKKDASCPPCESKSSTDELTDDERPEKAPVEDR